MSTELTAAHIAKQIASALHDEYDGFTVDSTDVGASRVPAGSIYVEGYIDGNPDGEVRFTVVVTEVEVDDFT